jgi:hypothetical protein
MNEPWQTLVGFRKTVQRLGTGSERHRLTQSKFLAKYFSPFCMYRKQDS